MNICFRSGNAKDAKILGIKAPYRLYGETQNYFDVVTIKGKIVLAMKDRLVIYQDGTDGIAELIRARDRIHAALNKSSFEWHRPLAQPYENKSGGNEWFA